MSTVKIKGMSCQHCVGSVKDALEALPGVTEVVVDLEKGEATYQGSVDVPAVQQAITKIGFEVGGCSKFCVSNQKLIYST